MSRRSSSSSLPLEPRCYESHPVLTLGPGRLAGGSAAWPKYKADVYVALQAGSSSSRTSDPWDEQKVIEIHYNVMDGRAPENVPRYKKMVAWLIEQLEAGKHVHIGCIGGHGRTGTLIAAIVAQMLGEKDAIQWVREHYCHKAVEADEQVKFLMHHFGVSKAKAYREKRVEMATFTTDIPVYSGKGTYQQPRLLPSYEEGVVPVRRIPEGVTSSTKAFASMPSPRSLWKVWRAKN